MKTNPKMGTKGRSRCWTFSANLNIHKQLNAEKVSDPISPDYINKVLNDCFAYQNACLKLEILSYSFDQERSHLMSGDALGVIGLIVNKNPISRVTVEIG